MVAAPKIRYRSYARLGRQSPIQLNDSILRKKTLPGNFLSIGSSNVGLKIKYVLRRFQLELYLVNLRPVIYVICIFTETDQIREDWIATIGIHDLGFASNSRIRNSSVRKSGWNNK